MIYYIILDHEGVRYFFQRKNCFSDNKKYGRIHRTERTATLAKFRISSRELLLYHGNSHNLNTAYHILNGQYTISVIGEEEDIDTVLIRVCPFCKNAGGFINSFILAGTRWSYVVCPGCGARGPARPEGDEKAIEYWNRRR